MEPAQTDSMPTSPSKTARSSRSGAAGPAPPLEGDAAETIDATGKIVAPGFVDIHTHYDGQVSWDALLEPSSGHGVTTVVTGNCGVGFAPVRPGREDWLIGLMEGVEDIPGAALTEGISWGWESLSRVPRRHRTSRSSPSTWAAKWRTARSAPTRWASAARATSPPRRTTSRRWRASCRKRSRPARWVSRRRAPIGHRAIDGEPVPGTYAAEDELFGLGRAMAAGGQAVFELAPQGSAGEDIIAPKKELEWMQRLGAEIDRPVSFAMIQVDAAPDLWREQLDISAAAHAAGSRLYPQIAARPFGMLFGFDGHHAFTHRPTFRRLQGRVHPRGARAASGRPRRQGRDPFRGRSAAGSEPVVRQHVCARPVRARPHLRDGRSARLRADRRPHCGEDRRRARRGPAVHALRPDARARRDVDADAAVLQLRRTATTTRSAKCSPIPPAWSGCPTAARTAA